MGHLLIRPPSRAAGMPRSAPVRAGANDTPIGPGRHWLHLMLAVSMGGVWYAHGAASCQNRMQIRPRGHICTQYFNPSQCKIAVCGKYLVNGEEVVDDSDGDGWESNF